MWYNQNLIDNEHCKIITCKYIKYHAIQCCYTDNSSISPMCTLHRLFENFIIIYMLQSILSLSKLVCTNNKLPIILFSSCTVNCTNKHIHVYKYIYINIYIYINV